MSPLNRLLPLLVFCIAGCSPSPSEDFDAFCGVVNAVNREPDQPTEAKLAKIESRSAEYTKAVTADQWKKIAETPLEQRYAALVSAAKSAGKADYKCGSYEKLLVTALVEDTAKKKAEEKPDAGLAPEPAPTAEKAAEEKPTTKKSKKKSKKKKRRTRE